MVSVMGDDATSPERLAGRRARNCEGRTDGPAFAGQLRFVDGLTAANAGPVRTRSSGLRLLRSLADDRRARPGPLALYLRRGSRTSGFVNSRLGASCIAGPARRKA